MKKRISLLIMCLLLFSSCSSVQTKDYVSETPTLKLEEYFNGTLDAWGQFQNRSGKVVKRFHVLMKCEWNGNQGVLDESFVYHDGTTQKRIWKLTKINDNLYEGRADDVKGVAIGEVHGNALRWKYTMLLPVDGTTYEVFFDDWMYLYDSEHMMNKSEMSKFGFHLGEVTLFFKKRK